MSIVAPRAGAWVETGMYPCAASNSESHPVRVRGLKRSGSGESTIYSVAPRAGAWVET